MCVYFCLSCRCCPRTKWNVCVCNGHRTFSWNPLQAFKFCNTVHFISTTKFIQTSTFTVYKFRKNINKNNHLFCYFNLVFIISNKQFCTRLHVYKIYRYICYNAILVYSFWSRSGLHRVLHRKTCRKTKSD